MRARETTGRVSKWQNNRPIGCESGKTTDWQDVTLSRHKSSRTYKQGKGLAECQSSRLTGFMSGKTTDRHEVKEAGH